MTPPDAERASGAPGGDQAAAAGMLSANAWVDCVCGQRHWGRYGAAGLLLVWQPSRDGRDSDQRSDLHSDLAPELVAELEGEAEPEVLLQHRAGWTHQGGTWALPGGARGHDETLEQAALREAGEEAGLDPVGVTTGELVVVDHGPWSYTYVLASIDRRPELEPTDEETEALAWVRLTDVAAYPLHPLFAAAWPDLRARLSRPAS